MKHIKDPIHGYIDVSEDKLSIINSTPFQRLRHINQLGLCSVVYPSSNHTRFSHSLGVMELSRQIADSVGIKQDKQKANEIAGLLHDSGHLPFSHTLEPILQERAGIEHEELSCKVVNQMDRDNDITIGADIESVKDIIKGEYEGINLISSEIDSDRLDYLLRDSYNTGIDLGSIELDTLIKFAEKSENRLSFNHKALRSIERILDARMAMTYSVYKHDTVAIAETMLRRCVEFHLDETSDKITDYTSITDGELRRKLTESNSDRATYIFDCIDKRNLYKTSYTKRNDSLDPEITNRLPDKKQIEQEISEMADVPRHKVLINLPSTADITEFQTPIQMPYGEDKLENVSPKPRALRENRTMYEKIHIFTPPEITERVYEHANSYFEQYIQN